MLLMGKKTNLSTGGFKINTTKLCVLNEELSINKLVTNSEIDFGPFQERFVEAKKS